MAAWQDDSAHVFTPFGIHAADVVLSGLAAGHFNLLEAHDGTAADVVLAHFLDHALKRGARVAVVAPDDPLARLLRVTSFGFDFERVMDDERLICVLYRPTLSRVLGDGADYGALFSELRRLTGPVERIAFLQPEVMFNLESETLAMGSMERFSASAVRLGVTSLGVYVSDHSVHQVRLRAAGTRHLPSAFEITPDGDDVALRSLKGKRQGESVKLALLNGRGYISESENTAAVA